MYNGREGIRAGVGCVQEREHRLRSHVPINPLHAPLLPLSHDLAQPQSGHAQHDCWCVSLFCFVYEQKPRGIAGAPLMPPLQSRLQLLSPHQHAQTAGTSTSITAMVRSHINARNRKSAECPSPSLLRLHPKPACAQISLDCAERGTYFFPRKLPQSARSRSPSFA